jgi:hypothetical protein
MNNIAVLSRDILLSLLISHNSVDHKTTVTVLAKATKALSALSASRGE